MVHQYNRCHAIFSELRFIELRPVTPGVGHRPRTQNTLCAVQNMMERVDRIDMKDYEADGDFIDHPDDLINQRFLEDFTLTGKKAYTKHAVKRITQRGVKHRPGETRPARVTKNPERPKQSSQTFVRSFPYPMWPRGQSFVAKRFIRQSVVARSVGRHPSSSTIIY